MSKSGKITSKGQITIPRSIRKYLESDIVEFEFADGFVLMKPVKSMAGSLSKYAKRSVSLDKVRDDAWNEVARERGSS